MIKEMKHVVVDLETMGIVPGCAIVSLGAVVFDPRFDSVSDKKFYVELDWEAQTEDGFTVDENTKEWWNNQDSVAREALNGMEELEETLIDFARWLPSDVKIWGNGATFDVSILEYCYRKFNIEIPWKFWNIRDVRTIKDLYESSRGGFSKAMEGTKHNALDDAVYEAEMVCKMWKSILGGN